MTNTMGYAWGSPQADAPKPLPAGTNDVAWHWDEHRCYPRYEGSYLPFASPQAEQLARLLLDLGITDVQLLEMIADRGMSQAVSRVAEAHYRSIHGLS